MGRANTSSHPIPATGRAGPRSGGGGGGGLRVRGLLKTTPRPNVCGRAGGHGGDTVIGAIPV